ncbi:MAG: gliding motility-associated C-terminal domain-containing protein [Bacteroidia bacterium]|nr:gliding motility-associated C-terminal domain-containing protein [Bacteroidia bacterium]
MSYKYVGSNGQFTTYRVTLYVYRDCSNDGDPDRKIPFDDVITVCAYRKNGALEKASNIRLKKESAVDPVGNTSCPELASACLKQGIYEDNIVLPNTSTGYKLKWERCCRNTQTNLQDDATGDPFQGQTYYTEIPASALKNSSPYFLDVPVPFICARDTTTVRNRAVDPDGDSLSYRFVTPWQGASIANPLPDVCASNFPSISNVAYVGGYNASRPFGNGGISQIDPLNGLTTYLSPFSGRYAVAIEVTEWRNGVAISTIRLDLQILVIDCKPNNKPRLFYQGGTKTWTVEAGATICKDVSVIDDKDVTDRVTIRGYGDMFTGANGWTGSKATLTPNIASGTRIATTKFCWKTDCNQFSTEPYVITFEAFDDGCPSKFVNENILIYVTPFNPPEKPTGPKSVCQFSQKVNYSILNKVAGNKYHWRVQGGTIVGDTNLNTVQVNWGGGNSGNVDLYITSANGCVVGPVPYAVTLVAAPSKPKISGSDTLCLNTSSNYSSTADPNVTYKWTSLGGNILGSSTSNALNVQWNVAGDGFVTLTVTNALGCPSPTDTFNVFVSHPQTAPILGPNSICPNNNGIRYRILPATPGSVYKWFITGGVQASGAMSNTITVDWGGKGTGFVKAVEINKFGCAGDTVSLLVVKDHALAGQLPKGDTSICEFTKGLVYVIDAVNGETYSWIVTGGSIISGQGSGRIVVDWGAAGVGSVGVQSTALDPVTGQPCLSPVRARIVNIRQVPVKEVLQGDFDFCQTPSDVSYSIKGFVGSTYEWEVTGLAFIGQGNPSISVVADTFGSFPIRVREITQYGCVGPWNDTILVIHPKPTTSAISGSDVICAPNITNYNYSVQGFANSIYNWNLLGGSFTTPTIGNSVTIDWNGLQNAQVYTIETSEFGCVGDTIKLDVFIDDPQIECRLVTVNPPPGSDAEILVFYNLTNAPRYNKQIYIQRRLRGSTGSFGTVGFADPNAVMFSDKTGMPDSNSYEYRAVAVNLCGDSIYSNQNTDVLLKGLKTGPFSYQLTFTDYLNWPGGVGSYELYRLLENKSDYTLVQSYNSPQTDLFDNGKEHYGMWFRIKAIENGGLNRESWSNDVRIYFEPLIFIPNAFSPDANGLNDRFLPNSGGMKTYTMRIYSRWGEKLFETENNEVGWDGNYLGQPAQSGIYVYVIDYTDYKDRTYQAKGTLHLMR